MKSAAFLSAAWALTLALAEPAGAAPGHPFATEIGQVEQAQRDEFEQAHAHLRSGTLEDNRRFGAAYSLVHLASAAPAVRLEVIPLLLELSADHDAEIAALAFEAILRVGIPDHSSTAFVALHDSPGSPKRPVVRSQDEEEDFEMLFSENPHLRLAGLERILHRSLSRPRRDDPRALDAFVALLYDPDPRVAHRAGNALLALAGDKSAAANVYVREK